MTTTEAPKLTRLDTIKQELMETYTKKFQAAAELGAKGDTAGMSSAIMAIQSEVQTKANDRLAAEKTANDKLVETEKVGKTALETHAQDVLKPVFEALSPGFEKLTTVGQLIFRMEKDAQGKSTHTVIVGNLTKVGTTDGTGRNGPRNHTITVNDKQFDTVALAWKGVMGDVPQPSKTVGKGESAHESKTRDVAVTAMEAAGHKVS